MVVKNVNLMENASFVRIELEWVVVGTSAVQLNYVEPITSIWRERGWMELWVDRVKKSDWSGN